MASKGNYFFYQSYIKFTFKTLGILLFTFMFIGMSQCKHKSRKKKKKTYESVSASKVLFGPISESKVYKLLKDYDHHDKFEASGLAIRDGYIYIVFDNLYQIAKIDETLPQNSLKNSLVGAGDGNSNFEGITYKEGKNTQWYIVEETAANNDQWIPRFNIYNDQFTSSTQQWSDVIFDSDNKNKGFEGIAYTQRNDKDYILSLVEGTGQIMVMQQHENSWIKIAEFTIPATFNDYSEIALYKNKIAVTSQKDAKLWIGELDHKNWSVVASSGVVYDFPKGNEAGELGKGNHILYANIEGIAFLNDSTIVTCTDKASDKQPSYQSIKDQSVQIFRLR
ncbi:MAG: SdiA-regulated domain-containing protein [Bacteroidetes bacterium]|nr:SdiA-regulated domain-containing protein [Bacteroidota bacterium]